MIKGMNSQGRSFFFFFFSSSSSSSSKVSATRINLTNRHVDGDFLRTENVSHYHVLLPRTGHISDIIKLYGRGNKFNAIFDTTAEGYGKNCRYTIS